MKSAQVCRGVFCKKGGGRHVALLRRVSGFKRTLQLSLPVFGTRAVSDRQKLENG